MGFVKGTLASSNFSTDLGRFIAFYRPAPEIPRLDLVFLTNYGRPLSKDRVENIMVEYGRKANISGVRSSPHTLHHTAAVTFLRNGGDFFSLLDKRDSL